MSMVFLSFDGVTQSRRIDIALDSVYFSFIAEFFDKGMDPMNANPSERRLLVVCLVCLLNEAN